MKSIYILSLLFFTSCSPILGLYGVHNPHKLNDKKIIRTAKRLKIQETQLFQLDTSFYSALKAFDTIQCDSLSALSVQEAKQKIKKYINNHIQPLQAMYFDESGKLVSFQINCYAGGFPNLKWNRDSILEYFPPKKQAPIDSLVSQVMLSKYLLSNPASEKLVPINKEFTVYVFWSKFMGRQNRRFLRYIRNNAALAQNKKVNFLFVNTDNFYAITDIW